MRLKLWYIGLKMKYIRPMLRHMRLMLRYIMPIQRYTGPSRITSTRANYFTPGYKDCLSTNTLD